jgi:MFS family permease
MLGGGWASDRLGAGRPDRRILLAAVAMLIGTPLAFLGLKVHAGEVLPAMSMIGAAMMLLYVYYATVYAAIQEVVEPGSRGLAVGLYFFAMYVLGASAGPVATGWLSDHFAHQAMQAAGSEQMQESFKAAGLHAAMFIIPLISTLCALVLYAASRTVTADVLRLRSRVNGSDALPGVANP